jgi:hypothetical protein
MPESLHCRSCRSVRQATQPRFLRRVRFVMASACEWERARTPISSLRKEPVAQRVLLGSQHPPLQGWPEHRHWLPTSARQTGPMVRRWPASNGTSGSPWPPPAPERPYRALLEHVRPVELLGLTATPERSDGLPLLHWFDDRVAAELRLWDAVNQHRLSPFSYYGVHDGLDLRDIPWRRGHGYDVDALSRLLTSNEPPAPVPPRIRPARAWRLASLAPCFR